MSTTTTTDKRGAGGKIPTRRRQPPSSSRTPYSRPPPPPPQTDNEDDETRNPNWLSSLIYPAKVIASGAGKIFSFFATDDDDDDDSSTSSGEDEFFENVDEVENGTSLQGDEQSQKALLISIEVKRSIERLVTQETFSREEGSELIKLIKSRIVDAKGTPDVKAANLRTSAILEARKWLQEKRSGSKKKLETEFDVVNLATPSQATRNEKGSPVDVAKTYMQTRPPWGSPSLKMTEFGSPSLSSVQRSFEETPTSALRSSELKKGSYTSGSWNILDEIRRVRAKATEELLAASPLMKTDLSSLPPQSNPTRDSLSKNRDIERTAPVDFTHNRAQNVGLDAAASLPSSATDTQKDGDAVRSMEHVEGQEAAVIQLKEDDKIDGQNITEVVNGLPATDSSLLTARENATQKKAKETNGNVADTGHDIHMVEVVNLHQEAETDAPTAEGTETMVNGSQNSSNIELSQDLSQPMAESPLTVDATGAMKERKSRSYTRRGRGRGK